VILLAGVGVVVLLNLPGGGSANLGQNGTSPPATTTHSTAPTSTAPTRTGDDSPSPSDSGTPAAPTENLQLINGAKPDRCLHENVKSGTGASGDGVHLGTCADKKAERWTFQADGTILNETSQNCLTVRDGPPHDRIGIIVTPCEHSARQIWSREIDGKFVATVETVQLCLAGDDKTIDEAKASVYGFICRADDLKQEWTSQS
jgi:hypothetical protein